MIVILSFNFRKFIYYSTKTNLFMKKGLLILISFFLVAILGLPENSFSQGVGIGTTTPDASAALDITHTAKGLLIPRMSTISMNSINNPARGLLVYDSLTNQLMVNAGTPAAPNWQPVSSGNNGWRLVGNSAINPANQFIGTVDNQPLRFRINNIQAGELNPATGNIFWGLRAGAANTSAFDNIAIGTDALRSNTAFGNLIAIGDSALFHNIGDGVGTGGFNIAIGHQSLFNNTTGPINIAIGYQSLFSNTIGNSNTATGFQSLFSNTEGSHNTATGFLSLFSNTIGDNNTANGWQSLHSNISGNGNTATGVSALFSNTTGNSNTAVGNGALTNSTTGSDNTAIGSSSLASINTGDKNTAIGSQTLSSNTGGFQNTAIGVEALKSNTTGSDLTAVGVNALFSNTTGFVNTATGFSALFSNTTGSFNTAHGEFALHDNTTGSNNTAVGNFALQFDSTGSQNTAVGVQTLKSNTIGSNNMAIGVNALFANTTGNNNTALGNFAGDLATADNNNTFIGFGANNQSGIALNNSTALGFASSVTASNQIRFGNAAITSIGGIVGYSNLSDGRFKKNMKEDVKGIDFIMKQRPVTYQLNIEELGRKLKSNEMTEELSTQGLNENGKTIFSGFVAQEVEQAAKDAGYDFSAVDKPKNENDLYGLRYSEFVVPLVKAVQEQQVIIANLQKLIDAARTEIPMEIEKQQQTINDLKKTNSDQKKLIDDLLKRIEKVEASLSVKK
jgi:hypothetical protein